MAKTYLIKDIDPLLVKKFKAVCAYYDISMKDSLISYMDSVVKGFDFMKLSENKINSEPDDLFS